MAVCSPGSGRGANTGLSQTAARLAPALGPHQALSGLSAQDGAPVCTRLSQLCPLGLGCSSPPRSSHPPHNEHSVVPVPVPMGSSRLSGPWTGTRPLCSQRLEQHLAAQGRQEGRRVVREAVRESAAACAPSASCSFSLRN